MDTFDNFQKKMLNTDIKNCVLKKCEAGSNQCQTNQNYLYKQVWDCVEQKEGKRHMDRHRCQMQCEGSEKNELQSTFAKWYLYIDEDYKNMFRDFFLKKRFQQEDVASLVIGESGAYGNPENHSQMTVMEMKKNFANFDLKKISNDAVLIDKMFNYKFRKIYEDDQHYVPTKCAFKCFFLEPVMKREKYTCFGNHDLPTPSMEYLMADFIKIKRNPDKWNRRYKQSSLSYYQLEKQKEQQLLQQQQQDKLNK